MLFGSPAAGTAEPDSDIDLLVVLDPEEVLSFLQEVERSGKLLYEKAS